MCANSLHKCEECAVRRLHARGQVGLGYQEYLVGEGRMPTCTMRVLYTSRAHQCEGTWDQGWERIRECGLSELSKHKGQGVAYL